MNLASQLQKKDKFLQTIVKKIRQFYQTVAENKITNLVEQLRKKLRISSKPLKKIKNFVKDKKDLKI